MFLVVGLGNPGLQYENTRHNTGFQAIDLISRKYNISVNRTKFKGVSGEGFIGGEKTVLLKPSTYMNLSGESVYAAAEFYKIPLDNIIIIHDDISLDVGRMRIRKGGSAGGHNGIKDIIACLGSDAFLRIKIGVGEPKIDLIAYVLGKIPDEERVIMDKMFDYTSDAVETIIKQGESEAMNRFNGIREI